MKSFPTHPLFPRRPANREMLRKRQAPARWSNRRIAFAPSAANATFSGRKSSGLAFRVLAYRLREDVTLTIRKSPEYLA